MDEEEVEEEEGIQLKGSWLKQSAGDAGGKRGGKEGGRVNGYCGRHPAISSARKEGGREKEGGRRKGED